MGEAIITVNGVQLSDAQSMAVRVAMAAFSERMQNEGLGADEMGKSLAAGYLARSSEVEQLISNPRPHAKVFGPIGLCRVEGCHYLANSPGKLCKQHYLRGGK